MTEKETLQVQVLKRNGSEDVLQQRKRTKWVDGTTTTNGYFTWDEWEDVPVVQDLLDE